MADMGTLIARLGRFVDDMGAIIEELQLPKSCEFRAKVNDFNILNVPED